MRDVNQANPELQWPIFRRQAYVQAVLEQFLEPVPAPRSLCVGRFMFGERRQGLSTFVQRELMLELQHRGVSSVYLPMKGFLLQDPAARLKWSLALDEGDGQTLLDLLQIRLQETPAGLIVFIDDVDLLQLTRAGRALQSDLKVACEAIRETRDQRGPVRVVGLSAEPKMLAMMTTGPSAIWPQASVERFQPMGVAYVRWLLAQLGDQLSPRLRDENVAMDCFRRSRYCPGVLREVLL